MGEAALYCGLEDRSRGMDYSREPRWTREPV